MSSTTEASAREVPDTPVVFVTLDGEETTADPGEPTLPYGGTYRQFLVDVGVTGYRAGETLDDVIARTAEDRGPASKSDQTMMLTASAAHAYSSGTVALLKRIEELAGPEKAFKAASMVQSIVANGGLGGYEDRDKDLWPEIEKKVRYLDDMQKRHEDELAAKIRMATAHHNLAFEDDLPDRGRSVCTCGDWAGTWQQRGAAGTSAGRAEWDTHSQAVFDAFLEFTADFHQLRAHLYAVHDKDDALTFTDLGALLEHERDHDRLDECRTGRINAYQHPRDWWGRSRADIVRRPINGEMVEAGAAAARG